MGSSGDGGLSPEYKEVLRQYWTEVYQHYKKKGWLDKLIIECPVNEPNSKEDYDLSRGWADLIHSVSPELKFFVVEPIIPQDPAWGSLVGYSQVWAMHGNHIEANRDVIRERQAEGDLIHIYLTCDQRYPQPNFLIDQDAGDHRMIPWVAYKYHVSGVRYWATNYWVTGDGDRLLLDRLLLDTIANFETMGLPVFSSGDTCFAVAFQRTE